MADIDSLKMDMDGSGLYEERIVSDRKAGTIRVLEPVTRDGARDFDRKTVFIGETQIMTQMGGLPITFEIPAESLAEAVGKYGEAAKKGLEDTLRKIDELRERAAHRIVTPGSEGYQVPPQPGTGGSGLIY